MPISARVRLSPCLDRNAVAAKVLYSWEIDAVGVDIGRTDKPRLRIKKGTLEGGKVSVFSQVAFTLFLTNNFS